MLYKRKKIVGKRSKKVERLSLGGAYEREGSILWTIFVVRSAILIPGQTKIFMFHLIKVALCQIPVIGLDIRLFSAQNRFVCLHAEIGSVSQLLDSVQNTVVFNPSSTARKVLISHEHQSYWYLRINVI